MVDQTMTAIDSTAEVAVLASDADCLAAYQASRSERAFNAIVERHGAMVFRTCFRLLNHVQEAEDAAQAVFLVLAAHSQSVRPSLALWLHDRARDSARVVLKSRVRRQRREVKAVETMRHAAMKGPDHRTDLRMALDAAIARLPENQREALVLRYLEGHGVESSARIVGCSQRTFARYCDEGIKRLRTLLTGGDAATSSATLIALMTQESAAKISSSTMLALKSTIGGATAKTVVTGSTAQALLKTMLWANAKMVVSIALVATAAVVSVPVAIHALQLPRNAPPVQIPTVPASIAPPLPVAPQLTAEERAFISLHDLIAPTENEAMWERIPWRTDLWNARRDSVREQKPIFLFDLWGHPLTTASTEGLHARSQILSDPEIRRVITDKFIPCVCDDAYESKRKDAEGTFFWRFAKKRSMVASRIYCIAPDGSLLAPIALEVDAREARTQISTALSAYAELPRTARNPEIASFAPDPAVQRILPPNALVVRSFGRALESDKMNTLVRGVHGIEADFTAAARDNLWITESEWRKLIVRNVQPGDKFPMPAPILKRLCRYNLVDNTRGEGLCWEDEGVQSVSIVLTVEAVTGTKVRLHAAGSALLTSSPDPRHSSAGYEPKIDGYIEYDAVAEKIERFDLIAIGDHWGNGSFDAGARKGKAPFGVAFELASPLHPMLADAVPPHSIRSESEYFDIVVRKPSRHASDR